MGLGDQVDHSALIPTGPYSSQAQCLQASNCGGWDTLPVVWPILALWVLKRALDLLFPGPTRSPSFLLTVKVR
jgi:hypothetical protein